MSTDLGAGAVEEVERGDVVMEEVDGPEMVVGGGSQGEGLAGEGAADVETLAAKGEEAGLADAADEVAGRVFDGRERRRPGAVAGLVSGGGSVQIEGVVGPEVVVEVAEVVEDGLAMSQIGEDGRAESFQAHGAMEAFGLALGLRVIGTAVGDGDAEAKEPDLQDGVSRIDAPPTRAVVHEHALGEAVAAEDGFERALNGGGALIGADDDAQSVARVVVQDA